MTEGVGLAKTLGFSNDVQLEKYAIKCGFKDLSEFKELIYKVSDMKKTDAEFNEFLTWLMNDGRKSVLLDMLQGDKNAK